MTRAIMFRILNLSIGIYLLFAAWDLALRSDVHHYNLINQGSTEWVHTAFRCKAINAPWINRF